MSAYQPMEKFPLSVMSEIVTDFREWWDRQYTNDEVGGHDMGKHIGALEYLSFHSGLDPSYIGRVSTGRIYTKRFTDGERNRQKYITFANVDKLITAMGWEHEWNGRLAPWYNSHVNWTQYRDVYRQARKNGYDPHGAKDAADAFLEMAA